MIKKYLSILKFKKKNIKIFLNDIKDNENKILVEIFDHPGSQISYSYFSNILARLNDANIVSYFPRKTSFKSYLYNLFFPFSPYSIQKSFGSKNVINPSYKVKSFFKIYKKIKSKKDILKITLNNIIVGDLIYDEYLAKNRKSTVDFDSKLFKNHLIESQNLFNFWYDYISRNKVKALILSHPVYLGALPGRIATHLNIPVYYVSDTATYCLDRQNYLLFSNYKFSKKKFLSLKKNIKLNLILKAKKQILSRFKGLKDIKLLNDRKVSHNIFGQFDKTKLILKKNSKKFKILIATHCFQDAVHVYGDYLFEDFFEWINFIGIQSNKIKNYEWYLKCHPAVFDRNSETLKYFTKKYPRLILLPKNITHNQLIYEGIGAVLTVYGSIGHEYPLFGIPVVNASSHGPHDLYKFNFYAKNKKTYLDLIQNLHKIKINSNNLKNQIFEYFAMSYLTEYNIYKNYNIDPQKYLEDYESNLYNIWLEEFNLTHHKKILNDYENFIKKKEFKMFAINNSKKSIFQL